MAKKSSAQHAVRTAKKLYKTNPKLFAVLVVVVIVVAVAVVALYITHPELFGIEEEALPESGELKVYFLDIGQGDCIYIAFPDGKDMLIDCGSEGGSATYKTSILSDLSGLATDGKIDYLFITHPDLDHVAYMDEVIETYEVANIYLPFVSIADAGSTATTAEIAQFDGGYPTSTASYKKVVKDAYAEENCTVCPIVGNFEIEITDDVEFMVYALEKEDVASLSNVNGLSPICLMTYANRTVVFTGDAIGKDTDDYLDETPTTNCDVLKVAHHGSQTYSSNSADFYEDISVEYAVISVGADNDYNLPNETILNRLNDYHITVYRTDKSGNITLTISNTGEMSFATEKVA